MKQYIIILLLLPLSFSVLAQKEVKLIRKGNNEFKKGNFKEAEINYRKSLEFDNNSVKGEFNLGDALYLQENYEESAQVFDRIGEKIADNNQKSEVYHNLGNSLLESKKYKESIEAYKRALRNNPADMDTKYNLEYAKQKLKEQEQEKQDNKEDQQNQDQQDQQDQQNKPEDQNQDQQDQKDQQSDQKEDNNQQPQPKQISKQDAERMLEALKNEEKKTLEKIKKEKAKNAKGKKTEKDW